ncbi:MAG: hypothetical protein LBS73_06535 [Campylobacteraceae bacterium]|jgi:hypothetical protein|nr:hypothetical protein [Campylobacteraceae bacterium]
MLIIGHALVPFKAFYWVKLISDITPSSSGSNVIFRFDNINYKQLTDICRENAISFAVEIYSVKEALLSNAAGASYLVVNDKVLAKNVQDLAEHYLFDAKVLLRISQEKEIKDTAQLGIDGVLFAKGEK